MTFVLEQRLRAFPVHTVTNLQATLLRMVTHAWVRVSHTHRFVATLDLIKSWHGKRTL
jgi:hypothetical protein